MFLQFPRVNRAGAVKQIVVVVGAITSVEHTTDPIEFQGQKFAGSRVFLNNGGELRVPIHRDDFLSAWQANLADGGGTVVAVPVPDIFAQDSTEVEMVEPE